MKGRTLITIVILAGVIALGMGLNVAFTKMRPPTPKTPEIEYKRHVKVDVVEYDTLMSVITASGRAVSGNEVALVAEMAGKLERGAINLRKGVAFKKGQILADVYKDEFELNLRADKSRFLNIVSNFLPDMEVDYPNSYSEFKAFFNKTELDKALPKLPEVKESALKIFLSSRNFFSEYYKIKTKEKNLARFTLRAPFNGTFTQVNFEVGAYVNPGAQIARMIRTDNIQVEIPVVASEAKWISKGDTVTLKSASGQKVYKAIVVYKANFVDNITQSQNVFAKIINRKSDMALVGEYFNASFAGRPVYGVVEIPRSALFNHNEVFTVNNGRLDQKSVDVVKLNDKTALIKGLPVGAKLVNHALINAKDNMPVEIINN